MSKKVCLLERVYEGEQEIAPALLNDLSIIREAGRVAGAEDIVSDCIRQFLRAVRCRWVQEDKQQAGKALLKGLKDYCTNLLSAQAELIKVDRNLDVDLSSILFEDEFKIEEDESGNIDITSQVLDILYDSNYILRIAAQYGAEDLKDTATQFWKRLVEYEKKYSRYISDVKALQTSLASFRKIKDMDISEVQSGKEINAALDELRESLTITNKEIRNNSVSYAVASFMQIHTDFMIKYPIPFQIIPIALRVYCDHYEVKDILSVYRDKISTLFDYDHSQVGRSLETRGV